MIRVIFFILIFFSESNAKIVNLSEHSTLEIIDKQNTLKSGKYYFFGISIKLDKGWKTYWKNPGDSGAPLIINSEDNRIKNFEIQYPTPKRFYDLGIETIGYEKEVIFPIKVEVIENFKIINFDVQIEYLVCKEICIPVNKEKKIILYSKNNIASNKLNDSLNNLPKKEDIFFELKDIKNEGKKFIVEFQNKKNLTNNIDLFLYSEQDFSKKNELINSDKLLIELDVESDEIQPTNELVILISGKNFAEEKVVKLIKANKNQLFSILFLAIVGGLILNFMPCVLPVLSLKIYTFIKLSNQDQFKIIKLSLSTISGIFCSFIILALSTILLKELGREISWGMQFQSKEFLLLFSFILFVFSLNLFGFYEILLPSSIINKLSFSKKNEYLNAFSSGLLATILATPCSAPFLGTSVSFAFSQENLSTLSIFLALAFGFSLPYFLIIISPRLINFLPKPGRWMTNLRYLLGFMVLLMSFWLISISNFLNVFVLILIGVILLLFIFLKLKIKSKSIAIYIISFLFLISIFFLREEAPQKVKWENFNEKILNTYIDNNELIFLDVTANWCITCKFNKFTTLENDEIKSFFFENNVKLIQADWTEKDISILNFLKKYNRYGIPFNIVYGPKKKEGIILSEILTKEAIKKNINLLK